MHFVINSSGLDLQLFRDAEQLKDSSDTSDPNLAVTHSQKVLSLNLQIHSLLATIKNKSIELELQSLFVKQGDELFSIVKVMTTISQNFRISQEYNLIFFLFLCPHVC